MLPNYHRFAKCLQNNNKKNNNNKLLDRDARGENERAYTMTATSVAHLVHFRVDKEWVFSVSHGGEG